MKGFKDLIDAYEPISHKACATAAMRNAKNGEDLVAAVQLQTNIKISILTCHPPLGILCLFGNTN